MLNPEIIAVNYQRALERVAAAAARVGRSAGETRVVVVTKGQPVQAAQAAVAAGAHALGENYVEEALPKMLALSGTAGVAWHMIGHVQSRKAQTVAERFDLVHSLDSVKLAARLDRFAGESGRRLPVLLECNVSGEASKSGWPAWEEENWGELAAAIAPVLDLPSLEVRGLMTMPPYSPDPQAARPYFQRLRRLKLALARRLPAVNWAELSMGMSADFEVAVEEGATLVRIGTAILGERPKTNLSKIRN
jgi:pyridoxal phosphate enzyme (YggS family)